MKFVPIRFIDREFSDISINVDGFKRKEVKEQYIDFIFFFRIHNIWCAFINQTVYSVVDDYITCSIRKKKKNENTL